MSDDLMQILLKEARVVQQCLLYGHFGHPMRECLYCKQPMPRPHDFGADVRLRRLTEKSDAEPDR